MKCEGWAFRLRSYGKDIALTLNVVVPGPALVFASSENIKAPESSKPFSELVVLMFVITGIVRLGILTGLIGHEFKSDWVWYVILLWD